MSDSPQLDAFLEDQADDGASLGQAEFSIDRTGALRKLAEHSLPFAGAWLLKVVQAAVASGNQRGITVTADREKTVVRFGTARAWTNAEVRQAFVDPDPASDEVLSHLKFALWGAGISGKHPFTLRLPGEKATLVWSGGAELGEVEKDEPLTAELELRVGHALLEGPPMGFFERRKHVSKVNAENTTALANHAYTCPVPLTLDGRRLDSLLLAPLFFYNNIAQPVELGFLDPQGCPPWRVPLGTFDALRSGPMAALGGWGRKLADGKFKLLDHLTVEAVEEAPQVGSAGVVYLYVAHLGVFLSGKSTYWKTSTAKSNLYWVKDGVLIRHETFPPAPTALSVTCYVSADGLTTDLTTLQLVASDPKAERTAEVIRAMTRDLAKPRDFWFSKVVSSARASDRIGGGALGVLGTLALPILPLGLLLLVAAHRLIKGAGDDEEILVEQVRDGYPRLQEGWRKSYPHYLPTEEGGPC